MCIYFRLINSFAQCEAISIVTSVFLLRYMELVFVRKWVKCKCGTSLHPIHQYNGTNMMCVSNFIHSYSYDVLEEKIYFNLKLTRMWRRCILSIRHVFSTTKRSVQSVHTLSLRTLHTRESIWKIFFLKNIYFRAFLQ